MINWQEWIENAENDPEFQFEVLAIEVAEEMVQRMEALKISRTEVARRIGCSPARVTQILAGDENLTLKTLVAVAHALEARLSVTLDGAVRTNQGLADGDWQRLTGRPQARSDSISRRLAAVA